MIDTLKEVEPYVGSVIRLPGYDYGVILLRIYNDGFLTSIGFVQDIVCPDYPIDVSHSQLDIMYSYIAATELPVDFMQRKFMFANELYSLEDAPFFIALASDQDKQQAYLSMQEIDLDTALILAKEECPLVNTVEHDLKNRLFKASNGLWYSWCILVHK